MWEALGAQILITEKNGLASVGGINNVENPSKNGCCQQVLFTKGPDIVGNATQLRESLFFKNVKKMGLF